MKGVKRRVMRKCCINLKVRENLTKNVYCFSSFQLDLMRFMQVNKGKIKSNNLYRVNCACLT